MSYTFLQEHCFYRNKKLRYRDETLHEMQHAKTTDGLPEILTRAAVFVVPSMRARLPEGDLRKRSRAVQASLPAMAGEVRCEALCGEKDSAPEVLRHGNCSKIQDHQGGGTAFDRNRGASMQGVCCGVRPYKAATPEEFGPLPQDRKDSGLPLFAMQHRGWAC